MEYYIVDSVKGGCGKTTIAMYKAIDLANENIANKVCYLDMDILGTAIESFLQIKENPTQGVKYFSDMFDNRESIRSERCVRKLVFDKENYMLVDKKLEINELVDFQKDYVKVGAVFSSPDENKKKLFKPSISTHYNQHIDYDFFARKLEILFSELKAGGYTHIVIDMPPNSDAYTDSVFKQLLDLKKEDKVYLYLISTYDRSHIVANSNWLDKMIRNEDQRWRTFESISIILNDNRNIVSKYPNEIGHIASNLKGRFNKSNFPSKTGISIKQCNYSEKISSRAVFDFDVINYGSSLMGTSSMIDDSIIRISFKEIKITDL